MLEQETWKRLFDPPEDYQIFRGESIRIGSFQANSTIGSICRRFHDLEDLADLERISCDLARSRADLEDVAIAPISNDLEVEKIDLEQPFPETQLQERSASLL